MSKNDEFSDLRKQIQKLKNEREHKQYEISNAPDRAVMERVKSVIDPVLKVFVETDRFLEVRESARDFYITYAYAKICRISVNATSAESIEVELTADLVSSPIYSGSFNDKEIKNAVKEQLMNWYRSLV